MESDGKRMTILGMLVILVSVALLASLLWSFARKRPSNTQSPGGEGAIN
jgi:hypothetical protein